MFSRALLFLLAFALQTWGKESGVVFLIGDSEYKTAETVPAWARKELEPLGVRCTFLLDDPEKPFDFPQLAALEKADALFISIKRRGLPPTQLAAIRAFAESGKPVIGIRTASHALLSVSNRPPVRWCRSAREVVKSERQCRCRSWRR